MKQPTNLTRGRVWRVRLWAIAGLALGCRLGVLLAGLGDSQLTGDAVEYRAAAHAMLAGDWDAGLLSRRSLGYPLFQALLIPVLGEGLWPLYLVQAGLGAASCMFVGHAAQCAFRSPAAGSIAALFLAVAWQPLRYTGQPLTETLFIFVFSAAIWATLRCLEADAGWRTLGVSGALIAASMIVRQVVTLLPIVLLPILALNRARARLATQTLEQESRADRPGIATAPTGAPSPAIGIGSAMLAWVIGFIVVTSPVAIRGWVIEGRPYVWPLGIGHGVYKAAAVPTGAEINRTDLHDELRSRDTDRRRFLNGIRLAARHPVTYARAGVTRVIIYHWPFLPGFDAVYVVALAFAAVAVIRLWQVPAVQVLTITYTYFAAVAFFTHGISRHRMAGLPLLFALAGGGALSLWRHRRRAFYVTAAAMLGVSVVGWTAAGPVRERLKSWYRATVGDTSFVLPKE